MTEIQLYRSEVKPDWCPGCGDFGVLNGLQRAAATLNIDPKDLLIVSGIGCSSNLPGFFHSYGFHSVHGRSIPVATGARLANTDLHVVVTGGDGDGYGIGMGHLIHAMRRNLNITYVVMNNGVYGLTTGQYSPTADKGMVTKSTPDGSIDNPLNPLAIALATGATYVARGFSGDTKQISEIIANGIEHKGFSLIDIFSPCVTYNKINSYEWFRDRVYKLDDIEHDTKNLHAAIKKAYEWDAKIPLGLFYQTNLPTYEDDEPVLNEGPLVNQKPIKLTPEMALREFL